MGTSTNIGVQGLTALRAEGNVAFAYWPAPGNLTVQKIWGVLEWLPSPKETLNFRCFTVSFS